MDEDASLTCYPLISTGSVVCIVGSSQSGKSSLLTQILRTRAHLFEKPPSKVFFFSILETPKQKEKFKGLIDKSFQGMPSVDAVKSLAIKHPNCCIVLDDLMNSLEEKVRNSIPYCLNL